MRYQGAFGLLRLRDPIPLPQRLRLLGAAKRVERVGSDAGAVLGPGVVPSKGLVVGGEGGLAEVRALRSGWPLDEEQTREMAKRVTIACLGCSGPSAFSQIASARSKSGRAPQSRPGPGAGRRGC